MDEKDQTQEFDLDEILNEFHDLPEESPEELEADEELKELLDLPEMPAVEMPTLEIPGDTGELPTVAVEEAAEPPAVTDDETVRFEIPEKEAAEADPIVSEDATVRMDPPVEAGAEQPPVVVVSEEFLPPPPIVFTPRSRLRELKKKLVAGPEKRYYELSEMGVGSLQVAVLLSILIVALCAGMTTLYTLDLIPENRLRLVIFTQVLAMLVSALLGCHLMMDALAELFRGKFTANTLLVFTFAACCADAVFCLKELRVPCCAAFSLEMTMALLARYHRRSTEMSQMDTMRKAVRLHSIVKVEDFYEDKDGILRGEGQVEDFMDNYNLPSGPEKVQSAYAFLSLLLCIGIAVFAGLLHGVSLAIQVLSTSLLVALPASFFVALTRPKAILERRLHMVGTVLCGWKGVKKLCGKAAFPLDDDDLFPVGSTKLNGVKFYGDRNPDEVVSYTTSLICAAGGGLVPVFRQMLASRSGTEHPVVNFHNYGGGGIGGEVCDEPVLLGNADFLRDMGVEIPEGTMVNQAVYAAIDGQLCAVFAISYAKMRSAAAGIVTLSGYRKITPVLTGGDFMVTESLLRGKFGVNTRRMAFPAPEVRQQLSQIQPDPDAPALALTTREDLVSSAYAVTGARSLRTASRLGVWIHLIGGLLGMLIMLALAYLGSTELLTPTNVFLYQLVWMVPGLLVTEWTRTV